MAMQQATSLRYMLGRRVVLEESVQGFRFERAGVVVGVLDVVPGTRARAEFLLDQGESGCEFFDPEEVSILSID